MTFALMHTPNAALMLATFGGGLCWCALYLRERALLPIAVSHALSALALIALLPPNWLYSAEVSARFFQ
jgi:membrane protease YdiL (CAAX protease family)